MIVTSIDFEKNYRGECPSELRNFTCRITLKEEGADSWRSLVHTLTPAQTADVADYICHKFLVPDSYKSELTFNPATQDEIDAFNLAKEEAERSAQEEF